MDCSVSTVELVSIVLLCDVSVMYTGQYAQYSGNLNALLRDFFVVLCLYT